MKSWSTVEKASPPTSVTLMADGNGTATCTVGPVTTHTLLTVTGTCTQGGATITASDPNLGTVLSYSITGGADAALFQIDANTGALSFIAAPDFEELYRSIATAC